jgi:hypothetical protein
MEKWYRIKNRAGEVYGFVKAKDKSTAVIKWCGGKSGILSLEAVEALVAEYITIAQIMESLPTMFKIVDLTEGA